jgi:hypothetical protein
MNEPLSVSAAMLCLEPSAVWGGAHNVLKCYGVKKSHGSSVGIVTRLRAG